MKNTSSFLKLKFMDNKSAMTANVFEEVNEDANKNVNRQNKSIVEIA